MIIEQAFMNLPEALVGAYFPEKDYEASVVSVFSLAILQSLNSRNISNPMTCISSEFPYERTHSKALRADLRVSLSKTKLGTRELQKYGFKFDNRIEVKYYRLPKNTVNSNSKNRSTNTYTNTSSLLKDIIRLILLPTIGENGSKDIIGRYFLHLYEGIDLEKHLSFYKNNKTKGAQRIKRDWLTNLTEAGDYQISYKDLAMEVDFGWLQDLKITDIKIDVTNLLLGSRLSKYRIILTRINEFLIKLSLPNNGIYALQVKDDMDLSEDYSVNTQFTQNTPNRKFIEKFKDIEFYLSTTHKKAIKNKNHP